MAGEPFELYIDGERAADVASDYTYLVTTTGLTVLRKTVTQYEWTYSGSNHFLGFSKTQGATTAEYEIGSTGALIDMQPTYNRLNIYSVEVAEPVATYYKTSSDELTSIADAIRSKAGTSNLLEFPTGFVDAITNL